MSGQMGFWNHYTIHDAHRNTEDDRPKRSENRQRTARYTIRLLPSEASTLENAAYRLGLSISELIRWSTLDYLQDFEDRLKARRAELNTSTEEEQR